MDHGVAVGRAGLLKFARNPKRRGLTVAGKRKLQRRGALTGPDRIEHQAADGAGAAQGDIDRTCKPAAPVPGFLGPDRVDPPASRKALMDVWGDGWARLFAALESLSEADLVRTVTIRGEAHSVMQAINRQVAHYSLHVGQIVMLAKHFAQDRWQSPSVARNKSAEFNRQVALGERRQR